MTYAHEAHCNVVHDGPKPCPRPLSVWRMRGMGFINGRPTGRVLYGGWQAGCHCCQWVEWATSQADAFDRAYAHLGGGE